MATVCLKFLSAISREVTVKNSSEKQMGPRKTLFATQVTWAWKKFSQNTTEAPIVDVFKFRLEKEWRNHPDKFNYKFSY